MVKISIKKPGEAELAPLLEKDAFKQGGSFSGTGKSSLGNVLLGRPHTSQVINVSTLKKQKNIPHTSQDGGVGDPKCLLTGRGVDPVTKRTCAEKGRFGMSLILVA